MEHTSNQHSTFNAATGDANGSDSAGVSTNSPESEGRDLTFEKAMQLLEETVRRLEAGDLPLTESIERYKSAMTLVQYCRGQLDKAELEIEQLMSANSEEASQLEGGGK